MFIPKYIIIIDDKSVTPEQIVDDYRQMFGNAFSILRQDFCDAGILIEAPLCQEDLSYLKLKYQSVTQTTLFNHLSDNAR